MKNKGKILLKSYNINLFKELDVEKNIHIDINKLSYGSSKKVWWLCSKGHSYQTCCSERIRGRNCSFCAGKKVCLDNSLFFLNPRLCEEWNYDKNINIKPTEVTKYSLKKVWWKCNKGHEWLSTIANRSSGTKCKKCYNPNTSEIELKFYYYFKKLFNDVENTYNIFYKNKKIEIDIFIKSLNIAIEYDGIYYHKTDFKLKRDIEKSNAILKNGIKLIRIREYGLPDINDGSVCFTHNYKRNTNVNIKKVIIEITDYIKNNYNLNNNQLCLIKETIDTNFDNDVIPPEFFNYKLIKNSLDVLNPFLANEWHDNLNKPLTPKHVTCGSNKKVWWKCVTNSKHVWQAIINDRAGKIKRGCPYCAGKKKL